MKYACADETYFCVYIEMYSIQWVGQKTAVFLVREVCMSIMGFLSRIPS